MTVDELVAQFGAQHVSAFFLVLARVSPLFVLAPLFSSRMIPARVRGIVAVALAIGLSPVASAHAVIPTDLLTFGGLMAKELLVGLAYAFILGALIAALQAAGAFLDTLIGFSIGGVFDPINGNQSSPLSQLYALIGVMVFIAIDGDAWVIRGLARTYDLVGITQFPQIAGMVGTAASVFAGIFTSAIEVAGPVMLALIVTDAAFGVVSRVVPSLNVFAVGFPAKLIVGLLLLGVTLPFVAGWIADELQRDVAQALSAIRLA